MKKSSLTKRAYFMKVHHSLMVIRSGVIFEEFMGNVYHVTYRYVYQ